MPDSYEIDQLALTELDLKHIARQSSLQVCDADG